MFQLVVYFRTQDTWKHLVILILLHKTKHLPSLAKDIASHTGRRATGKGLYCGMNHPHVDALSNPCMHTDIIRRDLEVEDTMVTEEQCAGRQPPLIALTTSWGSATRLGFAK